MTTEIEITSAANPAPLAPELLSLAPLSLRNQRRVRYIGDNLHVSLDDLAPVDGDAMRVTYAVLSELLGGFANADHSDAMRWDHIQRWCDRSEGGLESVLEAVRRLGHATMGRDGHGEMLSKVLHDVRGGASTALLGRLQLLGRLPRDESTLKMIFVLTRDHLKIMRNATVGLDDQRRETDRTPKSHSIRLILEKWHDSVVGPYPPKHDSLLRMLVDSRHDGALTECCLESAAIDRIFYNLAANAARHCAPGGQLEMSIFPLPAGGRDLRIVLSNPVSPQDTETLWALGHPALDGAAEGTAYLDALFRPAVSSTGSGYGLAVVADFVAGAYGLEDAAEAVAGRYVGARLDGDVFRVFHWPVARNDFPQKLDDPHRPVESLSGG